MLLYLMSWLNYVLCILGAFFCFSVGLFYITELVEEYTVLTSKIIKYLIGGIIAVHIGLLLFEDLSFFMVLFGIFSHFVYATLLKTFPAFNCLSPSLLGSVACMVIQHYLAFSYFGNNYQPFDQIMAYFTVCLWITPFLFLISLSANELVLPQTNSQFNGNDHSFMQSSHHNSPFQHTSDSGIDFVSAYLKGKRRGLNHILSSLKDKLLPEKRRKGY